MVLDGATASRVPIFRMGRMTTHDVVDEAMQIGFSIHA
jgi:hypothetical protein